MAMKHALATTSVLALLAGPALAQAPTTGHTGQPAAGGSNIVVQQPAPGVTVKPEAPNVRVQAEKPNVTVTQPPPEIVVKQTPPNVSVETGKPQVNVLPAEKPNVTVNQAPGGGVGTTAPDAGKPGTDAAVAPAAGTFPMAAEIEKFIGKDVYGADGKEVGELNNVLIDPNGRVRAAIVEFGGFLGFGEHKVAVPWSDLNVQGDRLAINMDEKQIKNMPRWEKDKPAQGFAEYKPYR